MRFPATTRRAPKRTGRSPRPALLRRKRFGPYLAYTLTRMGVHLRLKPSMFRVQVRNQALRASDAARGRSNRGTSLYRTADTGFPKEEAGLRV